MQEPDTHLMKLLKVAAVSLVLLVAVLVLVNLSIFSELAGSLLKVMSSIFYGFLFAYLLNPFVRFVDRFLLPVLKTFLKEKTASRISRVAGLIFAFTAASSLIYLLVHNVAPRIGNSIQDIVNRFPAYYASVESWVLGLLENPDIRSVADTVLERAYGYIDDFVNNGLLGSAQKLIVTLTSSLYAIFRELLSMVIGVIVSIYVLFSKDVFLAQSKKLIVALCSDETADRIMEHGRQINRIFNGFIIGKIIDSIIIGILCCIGVTFLKMPYPELLSIIVGVTNVIPYFGPFIGAIPCAVLVLMVDPLKCLYFIIFIFLLQQVDGNIIGPRILGENVGISSFWILVSITIGGGLFGFTGMLLSVPVFAVIYMLIADTANRALRRKGKPTVTDDYFPIRRAAELGAKAGNDSEKEEQPHA